MNIREKSVVEYIQNLKDSYNNIILNSKNDWYTINSNISKYTRYYAIVEKVGDKEYLLKKGSLIYTIDKYDSKDNKWKDTYIKNRGKRISINTETVEIGGRQFDLVLEDYKATSISNIALFVTLVIGATTYIHKLDKRSNSMCAFAEESKHSLTSDEASSLSKKAEQQVDDKIKKAIADDKAATMAEIERQRKLFKYTFRESKSYVSRGMEYNKSKEDIISFDLDTYRGVYLTGLSGSGKTYMCKEVAGKKCNIDTSVIKNDNYYFSNLMWISCNLDPEKARRKFAEFCTYNIDSEVCVLVLNEGTKDKICTILPIWDDMDTDGKSFRDKLEEGIEFECDGVMIKVPKGLRILANVADGQSVQDIKQVKRRFGKHVSMNTLTDDLDLLSQYTGVRVDILKLLYEIQDEIISEYGDNKAFLVINELKYKTRECLEEICSEQFKKLWGLRWDDAKKKIREYIDNEI